ncbi:MAG: nucleotidyltransferase family protein, partial [Anaerolineales bacterium]|nr:nucleotidyltransferase family protein [Anaerolineales bacterium]
MTQPDAPVIIKPETAALMDAFSEADWELFARMAKAEGVAPLMHFAFSRSSYALPEAIRLKLQMAYYETAAFNQMILTEMGRVVQALNEADIPVIVLKGAVLATTIYPDPALRPMSDLDLLVKTEDLERAKELILSLGYYEPIPEMAKGFNRMIGHEYKLHKLAQPKISVELHWSVISGDYDRRTPSLDLLWKNRKTIISQNENSNHLIEIFSLSPEYLLCYLIGHLIIQHGKSTGRLVWL